MPDQAENNRIADVAATWSMPRTSPILRPRPDFRKGAYHRLTMDEFSAWLKKIWKNKSQEELASIFASLMDKVVWRWTPVFTEYHINVPPEPQLPPALATYYMTVPMSYFETRAFSLSMFKEEYSKTMRRLAMFLFFAKTSFCSTSEGGHRNNMFNSDGLKFKRACMYMEYVIPHNHHLPIDKDFEPSKPEHRNVYKGHIHFEEVLGLRFVLKVYDKTLLDEETGNPYKNYIFHANPPSKKGPRRTHEEETNNDTPVDKVVTAFQKRIPNAPNKRCDEVDPISIFETNEKMTKPEQLLDLLDVNDEHKSNTLPRMDEPGGFNSTFSFSNEDIEDICEEQATENCATGNDFRFPFPDMTFELTGDLLDALVLFSMTMPYSYPYVETLAFPKLKRNLRDDANLIARIKTVNAIKPETDYVKLCQERVTETLRKIEIEHENDDKISKARALRRGRKQACKHMQSVFSDSHASNNAVKAMKAYGRSDHFKFYLEDITVSDSLTRFGNFMAFIYERAHLDFKDDCNHDVSFLLLVNLMSGMRFEYTLKFNFLIQAENSAGKSYGFENMRKVASVPDSTEITSDFSKKALTSSTDVQQDVSYSDELIPCMLSKDGASDSVMKTVLSEGKVSASTCGSAEVGRRMIKTDTDKMYTMAVATNDKFSNVGNDMLARFHRFYLPTRSTEYSNKADRQNKVSEMKITPFIRQIQMLVCVVEIMIFSKLVHEVDTSITESFYKKVRQYYIEKGLVVDEENARNVKRLYIMARTLTMMYSVYTFVNVVKRDYFESNPDPFCRETFEVLMDIEPYLYATEEISIVAMSHHLNLFIRPEFIDVTALILHKYNDYFLRDENNNHVVTDGFITTMSHEARLTEKLDIETIASGLAAIQPSHSKYYNISIEDILIEMKGSQMGGLSLFDSNSVNGTPYIKINASLVDKCFRYKSLNPNMDPQSAIHGWTRLESTATFFTNALKATLPHYGSTLTKNTVIGLQVDPQCPYALQTADLAPNNTVYVMINRLNRVRDKVTQLVIERGYDPDNSVQSEDNFRDSLTTEKIKTILGDELYAKLMKEEVDYLINDGSVEHGLGSEKYDLREGIDHFVRIERILKTGWKVPDVPALPRYKINLKGTLYPNDQLELARNTILSRYPKYELEPPQTVQALNAKIRAYRKRRRDFCDKSGPKSNKRANYMDVDSGNELDDELNDVAAEIEQKEGLTDD